MSSTPGSLNAGGSAIQTSPARSTDDTENRPTLDGNILTILFPVPNGFRCPMPDCHEKYVGVTWTSRRQSLMRHLWDEHRLKVSAAYTCTICSATDLGYRPTVHPCISKGRHELWTNATFAHPCAECSLTFPNKKGLDNHVRSHSRKAAKQRATQPATNARSTPRATPATTSSTTTAANETNAAASSPRADPTLPDLALTILSSPLGGTTGNTADATATAGPTTPTVNEGTSPSRGITSPSHDSQDHEMAPATPGSADCEESSASLRSSTAPASTPRTGPTTSGPLFTPLSSSPIAPTHDATSRDDGCPAAKPAADEENSPSEGSLSVAFSLQGAETASAAASPAENQRSHTLGATPRDDQPMSSTPRSITSQSVESPTQVMSPEEALLDEAGNDPAPQDETSGEITLSGSIDDTNNSDDSDAENEGPAPTQPMSSELTRALMTLSSVYSGNMTLTEIEADMIAGKRNAMPKKISDFFAPKC
ncbi:hypothetical protein HPB52_003464 [Rhipicephalus sanguineus]|uniref:C2H2-type domain-containing protein n=1 Tax=Rhipicephalus sanguineus TaxID=34632 RepID=A0A9D4Q8T6_RHISA|nr:hypothetical protein HPB52_003464 [Rhipicephalus sanguineus]